MVRVESVCRVRVVAVACIYLVVGGKSEAELMSKLEEQRFRNRCQTGSNGS